MKSIDTNVLVRLLTQDDFQQFMISQKIFRDHNVFIPDTVIIESEWVLRFTYHFSSDDVYQAFKKVLGLPNVYVRNPHLIHQAINWHSSGIDFSDALHLAESQHCSQFFTFDRRFCKKAKSLGRCKVMLAE